MLLRNLTKLYVSKPIEENEYGERKITQWSFIKEIYLNLQQDLNELDRKPSGEIDYSIIKARTDKNYKIENGYGLSYEKNTIPNYRILEQTNIGNTYLLKLEKYNGN